MSRNSGPIGPAAHPSLPVERTKSQQPPQESNGSAVPATAWVRCVLASMWVSSGQYPSEFFSREFHNV